MTSDYITSTVTLEVFQALQTEVARLQQIIKLKDEEIRLLNLRRFGPKGEKLSPAQIVLLLDEVSLTQDEVAQEAERPDANKKAPLPGIRKPRLNHPGRQVLPEHLERREEIIVCCTEDCRCSKCGSERPIIGYEVREELACKPAEFWVRVIKREKRGSHCQDEEGVATAQVPAQIVPKSKLSNEFIIEVLAQKFQQHLRSIASAPPWLKTTALN